MSVDPTLSIAPIEDADVSAVVALRLDPAVE
jgi:hypothetical protein